MWQAGGAAGRGFSLRLSCTFGRNKPRTCTRADSIKSDYFFKGFLFTRKTCRDTLNVFSENPILVLNFSLLNKIVKLTLQLS